jgi:predicted phage terminase large subunit-like protein
MNNIRDTLASESNRLSQLVEFHKKNNEISKLTLEQYNKIQQNIAIAKEYAIAKAREDFLVFRQLSRSMHYPHIPFVRGDFVRVTAQAFQNFHYKTIIGESPILMLQTPVQHGKSIMVIDFLSWLLGVTPNAKLLFASFSKRLGVRANTSLQRILRHPLYGEIFPLSAITGKKKQGDAQPIRNQELIELSNSHGSFRNTTVGGQINGESMDIGVIDDVIKGRKEAVSPRLTETQQDWYYGSFLSRLQSKHSGHVVVGTPWEPNDLLGTIAKNNADNTNFTLLRFPAIAGENDIFRQKGEALLPALKDLDFLLQKQSEIDNRTWQSIWQCSPVIEGGDVFDVKQIQSYTKTELDAMIFRKVFITIDTAETSQKSSDYSVFALWGTTNTNLVLLDMVRGRWVFNDLLRHFNAFLETHYNTRFGQNGSLTKIIIETYSNGSALKSSIESEMAKSKHNIVPVVGIKPKEKKEERAYSVSHLVARGVLTVPSWKTALTNELFAEMQEFSLDGGHRHDDMVDCLVYALQEYEVPAPTPVSFGIKQFYN